MGMQAIFTLHTKEYAGSLTVKGIMADIICGSLRGAWKVLKDGRNLLPEGRFSEVMKPDITRVPGKYLEILTAGNT